MPDIIPGARAGVVRKVPNGPKTRVHPYGWRLGDGFASAAGSTAWCRAMMPKRVVAAVVVAALVLAGGGVLTSLFL
ncbi:hypothetical protein VSH64_35620 [Amycolatopsis rhabdoformis]|uniref:Uncharacterized protein n=1 Tax=Amycolatopsis rhabdoformis TaxID=1448059 RepID=A0ABZ1I158_9PSEU|nr:hypothetical protein [Amycolatopsis rhabdoformis]WSE28137.1 hypothetical protein VSH64_35620 [Amycolatopsis rhabdoformis]